MSDVITRSATRTTFSVGVDGIPDYVCAVKGDPRAWRPPTGHKLEVRCSGHLLSYVIEADRVKGWALCKKMIALPDGSTEVPGKEIFYRGVVTFRVIRVDPRNVQ